MKTKTFLLLCLFLGIGLTQLSAQNKTLQVRVMNAEYHTSVYCDGVFVDFLNGTATLHMVYHLKDGNWLWEMDQYKGEATGLYGEDFKISEIDFFKEVNG